jgi:hypothetical protein
MEAQATGAALVSSTYSESSPSLHQSEANHNFALIGVMPFHAAKEAIGVIRIVNVFPTLPGMIGFHCRCPLKWMMK